MEPTQLLFNQDSMNAPWGLGSRLKLVALACDFFNASKITGNCARIGKQVPAGNPVPLTVEDFLKYLEVIKAFPRIPSLFRVSEILERMASTGLLVSVGQGKPSFAGLQNHYLYLSTEWEAQRDLFRLVPVLGPEFLYKLCAPGLVHITGVHPDGDVASGTGLIIDAFHVLTCRHVVTDMEVDDHQTFQGKEYIVNRQSIYKHPEVDIAAIRVDGPPLSPLKGAIFRTPVVAQTVYTLGYPKLPGLKEASVTIQNGAVTNESVESLYGDNLFLYSAISRPGNSGGPVMSEDGYIVGLSVVDATAQYHPNDAFSPHYVGIPAQVVVESVRDLNLGVQLPSENYE